MRKWFVVAGWMSPLLVAALACGTVSPAPPASTVTPTRPVPVAAAGLGAREPVSIYGEAPLPSAPLGTRVGLDHDSAEDRGVMVFAVAYWSNTWGDPFLEARDGRGWSNAYTSAQTDPNQEDEINGGVLCHRAAH